jgi:glutaredoxin-dependent peroxiredoxin
MEVMVMRVGQRVPDFVLPDSDKKERKLSELTRSGNTIIAFFPFAFSGACDREMCTFRDNVAKLSSLRAQVVGISVDSLFALKVFGQTYGIEFPLLSDFNKEVTRAYGVLQDPWVGFGYKGVSKRAIFVVDGKGVLRYRWIADAPSEEPPYDRVMEALTRLN